jgi:iron(III) transport system permease protein
MLGTGSRTSRVSPERLMAIALVIYLTWQVIVPLVALLFSSFKDVRPSDPSFLDLEFTTANFSRVLTDRRLWTITATTAGFAVASSLLAVVIGTFLAWVTTQTNAPFRGVVASLVLYQLAVPELLSPISWNFLLGRDIGFVNVLWRGLTGATGPLLDVQSLPGMVWVQAFLLVPVVYLFAVPAISGIDRSLEEAALTAGASRFGVLRHVTLRLAAPALMAILILVMVRSWESFEVPWLLGLPVGIQTYATQIYYSTITPPSNTGLIAGYAVPMLAVAVALVFWYGRFNKRAGRYATVSGKAYRSEVNKMSGWARWALAGAALLLVGVGILLPILMLAWMSLLPFYRAPSMAALEFVNLEAYARVLASDRMIDAFVNSLIIGLGCSLIIVVVSSFSAWLVLRSKQPGSRLIDTLTFLPMSIPNIIVGICFLWLYFLLPIPLIGNHWGVMLAYVTLFLAIGARNIYARMHQLHPELDEAARISGASTLATMRTVTLPGLAPAVLASVIYVIIWAFKELPNALLLSSSTTRTAAAFLFDMSTAATIGEQAAVGLVILAFLVILVTVFQRLARRYGFRGF